MRQISRPPPKVMLSILHDLAVTALAFVLALYLRVGDAAFDRYLSPMLTGLPIVLAIAAISYQRFGLYRAMWRYISLADLTQILKAVTVIVLAFVLTMFLATRLNDLPRSQPLIFWFVLTILISAPRFFVRIAKHDGLAALRRSDIAGSAVPVILIGAGNATDTFLRWLTRERSAPYRVVGIVAEQPDHVGRALHTVPVIGHIGDLEAIAHRMGRWHTKPQRAILTEEANNQDGAVLRDIFAWADGLGMTLCRLPRPVEFKKPTPEQRLDVRPLDVADLLHRPQARLDESALGEMIGGQCVAITGAGGTIGGELARQVASFGPSRLLLIDHSEFNLYRIDEDLAGAHPSVPRRPVICDIRNADRLTELFCSMRPDLVFHAAALKHVPMVEVNACEAVLTNCIGSKNVANAAIDCGARAMVAISTDKAVAPSSVMGATKRIAERYCQALDLVSQRNGGAGGPSVGASPATQFISVRFGNVLGSSGSVVPLFERQLAMGGPITVTHKQTSRYFMTEREAVQLVLQASAYATSHAAERGRILVLEMGEPVNIADLARKMIRLQGLRPDEDINIKIIGLRPGEKLHETLVDEGEETVPTACAGVIAIKPSTTDLASLRETLNALQSAALEADAASMQALILELVPNFSGQVVDMEPREPVLRDGAALKPKRAASPIRLVQG